MDISLSVTVIWQEKTRFPTTAGDGRGHVKKLRETKSETGIFYRKSQNLKSVPIFSVPGGIGLWK